MLSTRELTPSDPVQTTVQVRTLKGTRGRIGRKRKRKKDKVRRKEG
jgi:hypothetical protein